MNLNLDHIRIEKMVHQADLPWNLLLLADPSPAQVKNYIHQSEVFIASIQSLPIGTLALYPLDVNTLEIKNLAVAPDYQKQGIGKLLIRKAIEKAKDRAVKKLWISTGNSSLGQLYLYQKMGFRLHSISLDYFTKYYPEPILENGLLCRDLVRLVKDI
ncbi:MAG: GNAT family N-acetyltransferase [Candidatus Cyclobacteriaceae bacterium M3_2C_046]